VKRLLIGGLVAFALAPAASGADQLLRAQLKPIAPARSGSGTFTAKATVTARAVMLRWQLSLSNLSGPATRATLRIKGKNTGFVLCKPCRSRTKGELAIVTPFWQDIAAGRSEIVVSTRAHPSGELRGVVRIG